MRLRILTLVLAVGACESSTPPGDPTITGSIVATNVDISIGTRPTIHVKESATTECGIIFLVRPATEIRRRFADGRVTAASESDLTIGRAVRVWGDAVRESCPAQSQALEIEILQ